MRGGIGWMLFVPLTSDTNASSRLFLRTAGADFDRPGSHLDFKPGQETHSKQSVDTSAVTLFIDVLDHDGNVGRL